MGQTANFSKQRQENRAAPDQQPGFAMRSHCEPGGNDGCNNQPKKQSQKKFHIRILQEHRLGSMANKGIDILSTFRYSTA